MEPRPGNVAGKKVEKVTHSVEHSVDWGHVAIGAGVIVLALVLSRLFVGGDPKNQGEGVRTEV